MDELKIAPQTFKEILPAQMLKTYVDTLNGVEVIYDEDAKTAIARPINETAEEKQTREKKLKKYTESVDKLNETLQQYKQQNWQGRALLRTYQAILSQINFKIRHRKSFATGRDYIQFIC